MLKITAISLCGSYPSWTDYAIGSVYNAVDEIIVVNSGYDINNPQLGCKFPEPINSQRIRNVMDIDQKLGKNKIVLIDGLDHNSLEKKFKIDYNIHEYGRSGNATYANRLARKRGADWILHVASDQIFYESLNRQKLDDLIRMGHSGYRFWQYADFAYGLEHHGGLPDNGTNDGSLFYISKENQNYGGQGAPNTNVEQYEIDYIQTAHMRNVPPFGIDLYSYYYTRFWYHYFAPNEIMEHQYNRDTKTKYTIEQIMNMAHNTTKDTIERFVKKGGVHKIGDVKDDRAPKDIPKILKTGIQKYMMQ